MRLVTHEKLDVLEKTDDGEMAKYKLTIEIPGVFSKNMRRESVQEMKKNSSFPGFRKGTIPPFIFSQIDSFVLRDATEEMVNEAANELNLERVDGEEHDAEFDFDELKTQFKVGTDFSLDCEVVLAAVKQGPIDVDKLEPIRDNEGKPLKSVPIELEADTSDTKVISPAEKE